MSTVPDNLRFADSHEWARVEGDEAVIGISDHAQTELTDIVYVELPEAGAQAVAGEACAVVESVKSASDIYAPVSGEVIAVNETLADNPGAVNADPYGEGWFFRVKLSDPSEADRLLSPEAYRSQIEG